MLQIKIRACFCIGAQFLLVISIIEKETESQLWSIDLNALNTVVGGITFDSHENYGERPWFVLKKKSIKAFHLIKTCALVACRGRRDACAVRRFLRGHVRPCVSPHGWLFARFERRSCFSNVVLVTTQQVCANLNASRTRLPNPREVERVAPQLPFF